MISRGLFFKSLFLSFILVSLVLTSGCATVKGWVGLGDKKAEQVAAKPAFNIEGEPSVKFSENSYMPSTANRQYKRMTRQKMEEESELQAQAGSMWVMEGQGAYLFAQNKSRREGDSLNIKIEGPAQKQIETKVTVIKKLLKQLEEEEKKAKDLQRLQDLQQGNLAIPAQAVNQTNGTDAQRAPAAAAAAPPPAPAPEKKEEKEEEIKIDFVPSRIVERQPDGNFRIKGQQPFMIGKREYKVIVTGIVRSEDYNDEGTGSNKIIDPQYDVVSIRKKEL